MRVTLIDPKDYFEMVWVNPRAMLWSIPNGRGASVPCFIK
jgi:hypothetical protein